MVQVPSGVRHSKLLGGEMKLIPSEKKVSSAAFFEANGQTAFTFIPASILCIPFA